MVPEFCYVQNLKKDWKMDDDFCSSLQKTLYDVLKWVPRINSFDEEEILSQILNIEQILILLNHMPKPSAHLEISEEDQLQLM